MFSRDEFLQRLAYSARIRVDDLAQTTMIFDSVLEFMAWRAFHNYGHVVLSSALAFIVRHLEFGEALPVSGAFGDKCFIPCCAPLPARYDTIRSIPVAFCL